MRLALALLFPAVALWGQFSAGIKIGSPLSDVFKGQGFPSTGPLSSETKRYTIGPVVELRLPFGLGAEFDALYKRFDQTLTAFPGASGSLTVSGSSWEFPLVAKYRAPGLIVRPYMEGGVSFNRLSGWIAPFRGTVPAKPPTGTETREGIVLGAGLEVKLPVVRVSPGIRYTHWGSKLFIPSTDLIDFLVGFTF